MRKRRGGGGGVKNKFLGGGSVEMGLINIKNFQILLGEGLYLGFTIILRILCNSYYFILFYQVIKNGRCVR